MNLFKIGNSKKILKKIFYHKISVDFKSDRIFGMDTFLSTLLWAHPNSLIPTYSLREDPYRIVLSMSHSVSETSHVYINTLYKLADPANPGSSVWCKWLLLPIQSQTASTLKESPTTVFNLTRLHRIPLSSTARILTSKSFSIPVTRYYCLIAFRMNNQLSGLELRFLSHQLVFMHLVAHQTMVIPSKIVIK